MVDHADKGASDKEPRSEGEDAAVTADDTGDKNGPASAARAGGENIPRWRQIEIMQERAQLRKLLDDFDLDFEELEVEVFGSEAEHDIFYRHLGDYDEEEEEIDIDDDEEDDDYEDDDYEDLED